MLRYWYRYCRSLDGVGSQFCYKTKKYHFCKKNKCWNINIVQLIVFQMYTCLKHCIIINKLGCAAFQNNNKKSIDNKEQRTSWNMFVSIVFSKSRRVAGLTPLLLGVKFKIKTEKIKKAKNLKNAIKIHTVGGGGQRAKYNYRLTN